MSDSDRRQMTASFMVRCTPDDLAVIDRKADQAGMSRSGLARYCLLGNPGPRATRRAPADHRQLMLLLEQVGRLGNNVNQIARKLNLGQEPETLDADLRQAMLDINGMRADIRAALGREP